MSLHNCRVVLVRPQIAENLGATARVMRNMGLRDLVLVAPQADPADQGARKLSTHGEMILDQVHVVSELGEALADCSVVAATSARTGKLIREQFGPPHEIMPIVAKVCSDAKAALVFGPESCGLTNDEVTRCHYLIHIPTDPAYPALNLAQAVAICLYELRRSWLERQVGNLSHPPAPFAEQERMFTDLRLALEEIHFLYGPKADSLMHALRHLVGRAQPTETEVKMLLGLARQIRWYVEHHHQP